MNETDKRYRTILEELVDENSEHRRTQRLLIDSCYRTFLRLIRYTEDKALAVFIEHEKGLLRQKFNLLQKHDFARPNNFDGRDALLSEWAKLHYEGAESYFKETVCEDEKNWEEPDESGCSWKEYFKHIIER